MHLSKHQIEEFRVLYAKEFGKIVTEEEAGEIATRLINLYLTIYRPLPGENHGPFNLPSEDHRDPDASFPNPE